MNQLIFSYISRQKKAIFLLLLFWAAGGWLLHRHHHYLFALMSYYAIKPPLLFAQQEKKVLPYVRRAEKRIHEHKIDLKLMTQACAYYPSMYRINWKERKPDFLEQIRNWKISYSDKTDAHILKQLEAKGQKAFLVKPASYWKENLPLVLLSLKDIANALEFGDEVSSEKIHPLGTSSKEDIKKIPSSGKSSVVPLARLFAKYAKAICRPELAMIVWGNYISFQERKSQKREQSFSSRKKTLPLLKKDSLYREAIYGYIEGKNLFPSKDDFQEVCHTRNKISLTCFSPQEGISAYHRLHSIETSWKHPQVHLYLAEAYLQATFQESFPHGSQKKKKYYREQAIKNLQQATRSYTHEADARMRLAFLRLEQKQYAEALKELHKISSFQKQAGFQREKYYRLAHRTLVALGRWKDAECLSKLAKYGNNYQTLSLNCRSQTL